MDGILVNCWCCSLLYPGLTHCMCRVSLGQEQVCQGGEVCGESMGLEGADHALVQPYVDGVPGLRGTMNTLRCPNLSLHIKEE